MLDAGGKRVGTRRDELEEIVPRVEVASGQRRLEVHIEGAGDPIVFLHGSMSTGSFCVTWLRPLTEHHLLIAPDIRGRGASICRDASSYSWDAYVDDLLAVVDHFGLDSAIVGGISLGAGIALATAIAHPHRVQGLILVSSPFAGEEAGTSDYQRAALTAAADLARRIRIDGLDAAIPPPETGAIDELAVARRRRWQQHDVLSACAATLADSRIGQPFHSYADLEAVTCPVLVVPGNDLMHRRDISQAYVKVLPHPTLVEIPVEPDALSDAIRTWMTASSGRTSC